MHFHRELGPAPKVGLEVEVVEWLRERRNVDVADELVDAGFMPEGVYGARHEYKCTCGTCENIGLDSSFPVMWKMQRDASLPTRGAEFISSPFPTDSAFVDNALAAIEIISRGANWTLELENERHDGMASPGLHVHCHAAGPEILGMDTEQLRRALEVYYDFLPELFALADSAGMRRGLEYRLPARDGGHHAFLAYAGNQRMRRSDNVLRLEWRLFEMPYDDMAYVEGVIYLCAALTQLTVRPAAFRGLGAAGMLMPWDPQSATTVERIIAQFSAERYNIFQHAVLNGTALRDDRRGADAVTALFARV